MGFKLIKFKNTLAGNLDDMAKNMEQHTKTAPPGYLPADIPTIQTIMAAVRECATKVRGAGVKVINVAPVLDHTGPSPAVGESQEIKIEDVGSMEDVLGEQK